MTDDKEEPARIVTWEQWPILGVERFRKYPLAPKHTDLKPYSCECGDCLKVSELQARINEQCVIINDLRCELDLAMTLIKELENPHPCDLCGKSLYVNNPCCPLDHTTRLEEARK